MHVDIVEGSAFESLRCPYDERFDSLVCRIHRDDRKRSVSSANQVSTFLTEYRSSGVIAMISLASMSSLTYIRFSLAATQHQALLQVHILFQEPTSSRRFIADARNKS